MKTFVLSNDDRRRIRHLIEAHEVVRKLASELTNARGLPTGVRLKAQRNANGADMDLAFWRDTSSNMRADPNQEELLLPTRGTVGCAP